MPPERIDGVSELLPGESITAPAPAIDRTIDDLSARFTGTFSRETVERYVRESDELLAVQGVARHRSSRTASFAADRLTALGTADAERADARREERPEVLFVCVQNAGRSQLAAAILRQLAGDRVGVRTAGWAPGESVRTVVVAALDEIGGLSARNTPSP